jgi:hypothetical protein
MGKEDPCAHQAHQRANRLNHRKLPSYPTCERTTAALHSQKDSNGGIEDQAGPRICCNTMSGSGTPGGEGAPQIDGKSMQLLIHHQNGLPISAVFRLRYRHCLMRRWAHWGELAVRAQHWARGRWNGNWGGWGFDGQIRWSGRRAARLPWRRVLCSPTAPHRTNSQAASIRNTGFHPARGL